MRQLILLLLLVVSPGCVHTGVIYQTKPAAGFLPVTRRIALARVNGRAESAAVVDHVLAQELCQANTYQVLLNSDLQQASPVPLHFQDGAANLSEHLAAAHRLSVDSLLVTQLQFVERDGVEYGRKTLRVGDPRVRATIRYRVLTVPSGDVIAQNRLETESRVIVVGSPTEEGDSEAEVLAALAEEAGRLLAREIVPHRVEHEVELAGTPFWSPHRDQFETGLEAANSGDWETAARSFESIVALDPENHGAWHNLGVAYEALELFNRSQDALLRAIQGQDRLLYHSSLARIAGSAEATQLAIHQRHRVNAELAQFATRPQPVAPPGVRAPTESTHPWNPGWTAPVGPNGQAVRR